MTTISCDTILRNSTSKYIFIYFFIHDTIFFSAQSHEVSLPRDFVCTDCTLQILRQADDLSQSARFFSCADVDIVPAEQYMETCSGYGQFEDSKCECHKKHYGDRCQYSDECENDVDCGAQGKCIDHEGSSMPRKQCYCKSGWFGVNCAKGNLTFAKKKV
jgi:EGF-like domain